MNLELLRKYGPCMEPVGGVWEEDLLHIKKKLENFSKRNMEESKGLIKRNFPYRSGVDKRQSASRKSIMSWRPKEQGRRTGK